MKDKVNKKRKFFQRLRNPYIIMIIDEETFEEKGITHLDLHGVRHYQVDDIVIDFIYKYQNLLPLIIICGNSSKMIEIVGNTLQNNNIKFSTIRFGLLRIEKI